ncbi:MAG: DUF1273 family protein [Firmicutes bacterium]|nr:DUF1273 family protein [Bacillota bacterium]
MRDKTCCFTGHRRIDKAKQEGLREKLKAVIIGLIDEDYRYFGVGGAIGFDTEAALTVLELREVYPQIRLILVFPCENQTKGWKESDIEIYENIKARSDKYVYVSKEYTSDCMFKRNRHLVNNSSVCVCFLESEKGGTAYTVKYAKEKGLRIINLAQE